MVKFDVPRFTLFILFLLLAYLSYQVIAPFISYLIFSIVIVIVFQSFHKWIVSKTHKKRLASLLLVLLLLVSIIVPSLFIVVELVTEAPNAYASLINGIDVESAEGFLSRVVPGNVNLDTTLRDSVTKFRTYILGQTGNLVAGATNVTIGLFIMFFVMYYLFAEGEELFKKVRKAIPFSKNVNDTLYREIQQIVKGTLQGQLILGLIQGVLGGIIFWILGIPNPLFWGFVMTLSSIIPVIGSFIVWIPAAIWLFITGDITRAIILLVLGVALISQVDNFLRPYIVGKTTAIHPVVVLIGVLGGLKVFGIIGFITGPLILALFVKTAKIIVEASKTQS